MTTSPTVMYQGPTDASQSLYTFYRPYASGAQVYPDFSYNLQNGHSTYPQQSQHLIQQPPSSNAERLNGHSSMVHPAGSGYILNGSETQRPPAHLSSPSHPAGNTTQQDLTSSSTVQPNPSDLSSEPVKRKRGRPKGSKTKNKHVNVAPAGASTGTVAVSPNTASAVAHREPSGLASESPIQRHQASSDILQYTSVPISLATPGKQDSSQEILAITSRREFQWKTLSLCSEFYGAAEDLIRATPPSFLEESFNMSNATDPLRILAKAREVCDMLMQAANKTQTNIADDQARIYPAVTTNSMMFNPPLLPSTPASTSYSALPSPTVNHGHWTQDEENRLRDLAERSRGQNPNGEIDWDYAIEQFGDNRSRHQILIKATTLGLKPSTAHPPRTKRRQTEESGGPTQHTSVAGAYDPFRAYVGPHNGKRQKQGDLMPEYDENVVARS